MPAIRGFTFGYESTTTDAGVVIPICANEQFDLLVAVAMADTGATTTFTATPPTGWSILDTYYNTTPAIAYFKLAGASEGDLTIAATTHAVTNETYNGAMVAIRDVDQTQPLGVKSLSTYADTNVDSDQALGNAVTTGVAQSFTTPATTANTNSIGCFATARFRLKKTGSPTGNAVAKLYAHSGTLGTTSIPTGAALATSENFAVSTLTASYAWVKFRFPSAWYQFAASTNYVIAIEYSGGDASNYVQVGYDGSTPGHAGNMSTFAAAVWTPNATADAAFEANRFSFNFATRAATARLVMPQITTDVDDAIVLYVAGSSGSASTVTMIDGPVQQIYGGDGAAEGHGMGWSFQETAGTTPNNIYTTAAAIGGSFYGVGQVNPPLTGATIIPTHVPTDLCVYIDPIQGVSAYNGNTALAATADTNFGTTIGAYTANDATVAAVTDVGINSFHSMGGLTNAATAGQVSGAELIVAAANRFDFSSKNLLAHVRATNPSHTQRFPPVSSGRGFWMGVRSNTASGGATTGYKVWQVHAVDTQWDANSIVPILINNAATAYASSGTLDATVITSVGFWNSGIGALTNQHAVGQLWLMDATTVCGGNAAFPMTLKDLVAACGERKERRASILQGANQALILQEINVGNGGTNATYFYLDATAIEFPKQYDADARQINYNSSNDKVGLIYYPGASDTIIHTNSIVSSPSRYKWGLHASASTSASYNFSGTAIIGAGAIALARQITITNLTITNYLTIDASNITLDGCTINSVPVTSDSVTVNTTTDIVNSTIDVSLVTEGNRWLSCTDPSIFANNGFTGGGGHAIRISAAGSYALVGNTFTGFGPTVFAFNTTSAVSEADDTVTFAAHGHTTGDGIQYRKQGGTANIGLTDATTYYVRAVTANTVAFYTSSANAIADTSRIALTSTGSETHYINSLQAAIFNDSGGAVTLTISGGVSSPTIRNGASASTTLINNASITLTGLVDNTEVRVYLAGTQTVVAGIEDATDGTTNDRSFTFPAAVGISVDIRIHAVSYEHLDILAYTIPAATTSIPVDQRFDRNYENL